MASNGVLFWDFKFLMFSEFVFVRVLQIPRSCNLVAESLAKMGATLGSGAIDL